MFTYVHLYTIYCLIVFTFLCKYIYIHIHPFMQVLSNTITTFQNQPKFPLKKNTSTKRHCKVEVTVSWIATWITTNGHHRYDEKPHLNVAV